MIHLDAKTGYSMLRGYGSPEAWLARCEEIGATSFGLADYASTWGHVPFRSVFDKSKVKLLYGVQVAVVPSLDKDQSHALVTLIARDDEGLRMIYDLMSLAHEQTYYRPRLKWKQLGDLRGHVELILNECPLGDIIDFERLKYGYVGIGPRHSHLHRLIDEFECVATGSPVYPTNADREGFEIAQAVSEGHRIGEVDSGGFHMLRRGEYEATLNGFGIRSRPAWFENASKLAKECNAKIHNATLVAAPGDLLAMARKGAKTRGIKLTGKYKKRLEREISVIENKNFSEYFVFVADVVTWSKERMFVGPARGSAGGSLLCWLLGITEVDPLRYGTLFERFIDPTRSDFPDIDVDFPDDRRDEVFQYLKDKYGEDRVARLGTVSKLGGKSAINDVGKAYGVPFAVLRDINKSYDSIYGHIQQSQRIGSLSKFLDKSKGTDIAPLLETYPDIHKARLLDGAPRQSGVHAAGVCITEEPIRNFGVVDRNGTISLDLEAAEKIGLLKIDVLGLRTLSVLSDACAQIGKEPNSLNDLSFDDPKVFAVFNKNLVTGVFQFEGNAVRRLMKQMEVDRFDDLAALISIARPGPLIAGAAENFVQRRAALVDWDYLHMALAPYTETTFGTIIYQEQAMNIVRDIGGFDVGDVNKFRKATAKKDPTILGAFREQFVGHSTDTLGEEIANELWDEMCEFGSYAFNLAHAVAYGMISYMCAWFKAYHPVEFAVAQLRNAADDEQAKALLRELEHEGHKFVPFDPTLSKAEWHVDDGMLIGGFTSVKGVGVATAKKMISIRDQFGDDWLDELTEAQRRKLTQDFNTPWHDLNRFGKLYHEIYDNSLDYRSEALPKGARGPIYRIADIPEEKGTYTFLGRLTRRQQRSKTDDKGKVIGEFCNLYFEDDTGTLGCTINRYKWEHFKWLVEDNYDGTDWIVKGDIINDGRVWLFLDNMIQLGEDDERKKDDG